MEIEQGIEFTAHHHSAIHASSAVSTHAPIQQVRPFENRKSHLSRSDVERKYSLWWAAICRSYDVRYCANHAILCAVARASVSLPLRLRFASKVASFVSTERFALARVCMKRAETGA
jgi:hypothetical protein